MIRDEWKFSYTAATLAEAANIKRDRHQQRLAWWKEKKEETISEVRLKGLEVTDTVASEYQATSMQFSGAMRGGGAKVVVKDDYQKRLNECEMKIHEHSGKIAGYDGWHQVLVANPSKVVELDHDDYLYFFGK